MPVSVWLWRKRGKRMASPCLVHPVTSLAAAQGQLLSGRQTCFAHYVTISTCDNGVSSLHVPRSQHVTSSAACKHVCRGAGKALGSTHGGGGGQAVHSAVHPHCCWRHADDDWHPRSASLQLMLVSVVHSVSMVSCTAMLQSAAPAHCMPSAAPPQLATPVRGGLLTRFCHCTCVSAYMRER